MKNAPGNEEKRDFRPGGVFLPKSGSQGGGCLGGRPEISMEKMNATK